ncbi:MAG: hypothetical protein AAB898_02180 [Patescibacteria group bacterium]
MRTRYNTDGITLLEVVLYIGLFAIVILAATSFFLQFAQSRELFTRRAQMEQTAGIVLAYANTELSGADTWDTGSSSLGVANGALVYTNDDGVQVTLDRPTEVVDFNGTPQSVHRLRRTASGSTSEWITPSSITVETFQWQEVTVSGSTTGLNLILEMRMINPSGSPFRSAVFSSQTTFLLEAGTIAL